MRSLLRIGCIRIGQIVGFSAIFASCASRSEPIQVEALLGCWYFEQAESTRQLWLPWGVELTPDSLEGWPAMQTLEGVRRAATLTSSGPRDFPIGYWRASAAGDSLDLGHPGGGGLAVELVVPAGSETPPVLSGTVRPVGDVLQSGEPDGMPEPAPVRLTSAGCP